MTALLFVAGGALIAHGSWWFLRQPASRKAHVFVALSAIVFFGLGLTWDASLPRRLGLGLVFAGLALESSAYNYWEGPFTRAIWRTVDRNPALKENLARRGIRRDR